MRRVPITRPALAMLILAMILVLVSGLLELNGAMLQAASHAGVEAALVNRSVQRELERLASREPAASLESIAGDAALRQVLMDGIARAPSLVGIAVCSPSGLIVAGTQPDLSGAMAVWKPPLPDIHGFSASLGFLWTLWRAPQTYQVKTLLRRGDEPFAELRVDLSGAFLWAAVRAAASRGMVTAIVVISLTVLAGILLTRWGTGRVRVLEQGIAAIRAGQFQERLPESGVDEFSRLARALNLLGEEYGRRRDRSSGSTSGPGRGASAVGALPDPSRALIRLGETAAGVAHELRNHLQSVQINLDELKRADFMTTDQLRQRVEDATRGVQSMSGAVRGFLKVARLRPLAPVGVDLNELLAQIRDELAEETSLAGVDLRLQPELSVPEVWLDPEVLRRSIHNLVRNSLQALDGREGQVTISTALLPNAVRISVIDDGPGIPPEVLESVFDLYFTTRTDGSGVGLSLVRQSAEMHGGEVTIHTVPGGGTEVAMILPLRISSPEGSGR